MELNATQRKHLGGEPPIYPVYPLDLSYKMKNTFKEERYLASPNLILQKYASGPIAPLEKVELPHFSFDQEEFNQLYSSHTFKDSCRLFEMYNSLNGNFIILSDRMDKSVVDVQQWFFEVYNGILRLRRQPISHPVFDIDREILRRESIEQLMKQDNTEEETLAVSYYTFKDKKFIQNGFKKLPETDESEQIQQGLPGSHKFSNRGATVNYSREPKERENKHELIRKQGVHVITSLLPIPKLTVLQKAHDVMLEILGSKGSSKLVDSLYPPNLSKSGGIAMPSLPLLSKYLKVRLLAIKLAEYRRKKK